MQGWNTVVSTLNYEQRLEVQKMMDRGATPVILYTWFNILNGTYDAFPPGVRDHDVLQLKTTYPAWSNDIDNWIKQHEETTSRQRSDQIKN